MYEQNLDCQLVLPGMQQQNAVERAIRTFKNNFKAGLASTDEDSPIHLLCHLIQQAYTTLNHLRNSRTKPRLSSKAQLNGVYNYNSTSLSPPGIRVVIP